MPDRISPLTNWLRRTAAEIKRGSVFLALDNILQVDYNMIIYLWNIWELQCEGGIIILKHGILGLLNYHPMTGYEIMLVFRDSLRFFWSAQTSQIYRELQRPDFV